MASAKELHNTIRPQGPKDITDYYTDGSLWDRLYGINGYGLYQDLYAGDYFKMHVNGDYGHITAPNSDITGSSYITIIGIDWLSRVSKSHHIVCVPGKGYNDSFHFGRYKMRLDETESTQGYAGSYIHNELLGPVATSTTTGTDLTINQQLYNEFTTHLITRNEELTNKVNPTGYNRLGLYTGCSSSMTQYSSDASEDDSVPCQAVILSEYEVYGKTIWASSKYDVGGRPTRFPAFKDIRIITNGKNPWWLRDIVSTKYFPFVYSCNMSYYENAEGIWGCIRPRFILG